MYYSLLGVYYCVEVYFSDLFICVSGFCWLFWGQGMSRVLTVFKHTSNWAAVLIKVSVHGCCLLLCGVCGMKVTVLWLPPGLTTRIQGSPGWGHHAQVKVLHLGPGKPAKSSTNLLSDRHGIPLHYSSHMLLRQTLRKVYVKDLSVQHGILRLKDISRSSCHRAAGGKCSDLFTWS